MMRRIACVSLTALVLLFSLITGCGDDDSTGPSGPPADFSGRWDADAEVVSRAVCSREVGDLNSFIVEIAQRGSEATLFFESATMTLAVAGSRATGTAEINGFVIEVDYTREGDELLGTFSLTDIEKQCTEVQSITATRLNAIAAPDFAGDWDLDIEIGSSGCGPETVGMIEEICRRIQVDSYSIWIEEDDGVLLGIADGTDAMLERYTEDEWLRVQLTVAGNTLTGSISAWDPIEQCEERGTIDGARRSAPCGEAGTSGDWAGVWSWTVTPIENGCGLPLDDDCGEFFQEGSVVTVDGVPGVTSGNRFVAHEEEALSETVTLVIDYDLTLSTDGKSFSGTSSVSFLDSSDPPELGCTTSWSLEGTRTDICVGGNRASWDVR